MYSKFWPTAVVAAGLMASSASAGLDVPVTALWSPSNPNDEENLYEILKFANNVDLNNAGTGQETWATGAGSQYSSIIVEFAGNANINTFGIYDVKNSANRVPIFVGAAGTGATETLNVLNSTQIQVGAGPILTLAPGGSSFGFYLGTAVDGTFYSEAAKNGVPARDQMFSVPWQGGTAIAWEDKPLGSSDQDFNDMVLKITPVPEPTTVLAGALLLLPFGASAIRMLRRKH